MPDSSSQLSPPFDIASSNGHRFSIIAYAAQA